MKSIFSLLLFLFINHNVLAQKSTEILPNSITLPRLSTTEQNTVPPQQAGNIIYNADEKKLALHDGTNWNYLTANAATSGFTNFRSFRNHNTWTVPTGVSKIMVELWGGGLAGDALNNVGAEVNCRGGQGSAYTRYELIVTPNEVLNIRIGAGGGIIYNTSISFPTASMIKRDTTVIATAFVGQTLYDDYSTTGLVAIVEGEKGSNGDFSFQEVSTGTFRKIVRSGAGGSTYPFGNNGGRPITLEFSVPSGSYIGRTVDYGIPIYGGGGACNYDGSYGGSGRVHIYY